MNRKSKTERERGGEGRIEQREREGWREREREGWRERKRGMEREKERDGERERERERERGGGRVGESIKQPYSYPQLSGWCLARHVVLGTLDKCGQMLHSIETLILIV